ncbi:MAG: hypothetical protein ABSB95_13585 [Dissulfurispiraceae bacterium]
MKLSMEKRYIVPAAVVLALILSIVMVSVSMSLKKKHSALLEQQNELMQLKEQYLTLRDSLAFVESKKSLTKVAGITQAVDEIFRSLGLSQKVKSVKSTGTWDRKYAIEDEAEVQLEKVNMNEMVNIFYKIENAPMILSIKKTAMKTSFDSPTLMNITMTVSLIKPK